MLGTFNMGKRLFDCFKALSIKKRSCIGMDLILQSARHSMTNVLIKNWLLVKSCIFGQISSFVLNNLAGGLELASCIKL